MGTGCKKVCDACGYAFTVLEGAGFPGFQELLRKSCLEGEYGAKVKAFVEAHPNCEVEINRVFSRCAKCGSLQNQERLRILVQAADCDENTDEGLRLLKDGSYAFYHREPCASCGGRLVKADLDDIEVCPSCGAVNQWKFIICNWD